MDRISKRAMTAFLVLAAVPLGTGCETCDPTWSAVGGAVVGAGASALLGGDTTTTIVAGVAGGAIGYAICKASQDEQREAELKAEKARNRMQAEEIARLESENRIILAKVGENEYVPVDSSGKASTRKIRMQRDPIEEAEQAPPPPAPTGDAGGSEPAAPPAPATDTGLRTAEADGLRIQGMTNESGGDTFNVVFVDIEDLETAPSTP